MARHSESAVQLMATMALMNRDRMPYQYQLLLVHVAGRTGLTTLQVERRIEALAGKKAA